MALDLNAIDKVFDPALILPIPVSGETRQYRVEDCAALLGLYCQRVWSAGIEVAAAALTDGDDEQAVQALDTIGKLPPPPGVPPDTPLHVAVLGDTYQQMLDDGVSSRWIRHAGMTTIAWLAAGDELAETYWNSGGRPEGLAPNREARRAAARSSSTAAGNGTQLRGSSSGTTSQPRNNRRRRAGRSGGTNSSPAGG